MSDGIFVCRETFQTTDLTVIKGTTFREGHPLLTRFPEAFQPLVVDYEYEAPPPVPPKAQEPRPAPKPRAAPSASKSR
ncbi:hypothetical protein [Streptomyces griseus]|uniref:hypothetical protein n=1 Tax=Streptomyces griseus TaxID=1911 RepID=UPI0033C6EA55